MENPLDLDRLRFSMAPPDHTTELVSSLRSFVRLFDRRWDPLQEILQDVSGGSSSSCVSAIFGGVLGGACGGVTGAVGGVLGGIGATTLYRYFSEVNAFGASWGFVGSLMGGTAAGVFCGAVGGAVGAATGDQTTTRGRTLASDVAWFSVGFATGGAIGGIFGGKVGAAGGAVGGAFGGYNATRFAVAVVCRFKGNKGAVKSKKAKLLQRTGAFGEAMAPLLPELETIRYIGENKMAAGGFVPAVAAQAGKTLSAVSDMKTAIGDCQTITDAAEFVSMETEITRRGRRVTVEMKTMRDDAAKALESIKDQ